MLCFNQIKGVRTKTERLNESVVLILASVDVDFNWDCRVCSEK